MHDTPGGKVVLEFACERFVHWAFKEDPLYLRCCGEMRPRLQK